MSASYYTPAMAHSQFTPLLTLTASPNLQSRLQICFRALPTVARQDAGLRPDLRMGAVDARIRRVGKVVQWFLEVAKIR